MNRRFMNDKLLERTLESLRREERKKLPRLLPTSLGAIAIVIMFTVVCIALDYFTLFPLMDALLTQQEIMSFIITGAITGCMNMFPVLLAGFYSNREVAPKMRIVLMSLLGGLLAAMFVVTAALRMNTLELMVGNTSGMAIGGVQQEAFQPDSGQIMMGVLLAFEPLATSVLNFALSMYFLSCEKPEDDLAYRKKVLTARLRDEIDKLSVLLTELEEDMSFDLKAYDDALYENMRSTLLREASVANHNAVTQLTLKMADSKAISYLMEEGYLGEDKPDPVFKVEAVPLPLTVTAPAADDADETDTDTESAAAYPLTA